MIYTVTLNPSIDYVAAAPDFAAGKLNRLSEEMFLPGGKGNNVSMVLKNLGIASTAFGFVAGFTGEQIEKMLCEKGIRTDFIRLPEGNSRINMKIHSISDDVETEINGSGPKVRPDDIAALKEKIYKLAEGDTIILAGSIPLTIPTAIYEEICRESDGRGVRIIVDAEKNLLERVLNYHPFLVKPNHHELGQMFDVEIKTQEEAFVYAEKLQRAGARNVIVSMAGEGAVFLDENGQRYSMDAPRGSVVNSVGAGDSMIAGFLAGLEKGMTAREAFRLAVFCGSACAFKKGLPHLEDVEKIMTESDRAEV